ncbi:PREDICTED: acid phosphatase 1 isoform X2 [Nicotiana attenuata]|uniref:Acid phosphatase 1 n=2 Tax=Nicotiana attenuata TaxID=49451 RepID=A0A1J6IMS5_NICAT|nr:PREDICTED: acid phosphatase 1 isoform X2 [Nicotiana attenuata]OIS96448.1 acid phosphatase 1 [Nicotiana attenuata]
MKQIRELLMLLLLASCSKLTASTTVWMPMWQQKYIEEKADSYCLSWRLGVETNNIRAWRTVPTHCLRYVENYMMRGQYERDVELIIDHVMDYVNDDVVLSNDGLDAWILDVDDTCLSNLFYYQGKRFGVDPYDPKGFHEWASKGVCPAIPAVLRLYNKLIESGFRVFLVTGRSESTLGQATLYNLHNQGFLGYERLTLREDQYEGMSSIVYKSEIRKKLVGEGYRIWGNVGDQWSDLQGEYIGNRTFKLPNPMYFVP